MRITAETRVGRLVTSSPAARSVLAWHGVDVDAGDFELKLYELCSEQQLEIDDVLVDLRSQVSDVDDDDDDEDDEDDDEGGFDGFDDDWDDEEGEDEDEDEDEDEED